MPVPPVMAPPGDDVASSHSRIWQHCEATDRTHHINRDFSRQPESAAPRHAGLCAYVRECVLVISNINFFADIRYANFVLLLDSDTDININRYVCGDRISG